MSERPLELNKEAVVATLDAVIAERDSLAASLDEWIAKYTDAFTSPPRVAEREVEMLRAELSELRARVEAAVTRLSKSRWIVCDEGLAILAPPEAPADETPDRNPGLVSESLSRTPLSVAESPDA